MKKNHIEKKWGKEKRKKDKFILRNCPLKAFLMQVISQEVQVVSLFLILSFYPKEWHGIHVQFLSDQIKI